MIAPPACSAEHRLHVSESAENGMYPVGSRFEILLPHLDGKAGEGCNDC